VFGATEEICHFDDKAFEEALEDEGKVLDTGEDLSTETLA